jgi:hypothetical protein
LDNSEKCETAWARLSASLSGRRRLDRGRHSNRGHCHCLPPMVSLLHRSPSTALRGYKGCTPNSSFPLSASITSMPPSSHHPLSSVSCHAPLFHVLSATAGSCCYQFVHLCVVFDWGFARQTCHSSEPTGHRPSRRSPPTKLCHPPPRTSTMSANAGPHPA